MKIITREEWGAAPAKARHSMPQNEVTEGLFVHWVGTPVNTGRSGAFTVAAIQHYHMVNKGWLDIAYSFAVDIDGNIYEGRGWNIDNGATAPAYNHRSHAVVLLIGEGQRMTPAMKRSVKWLAKEAEKRSAVGMFKARPHRDVYGTACPGDEVAAWVENGMPVEPVEGIQNDVDSERPEPVVPPGFQMRRLPYNVVLAEGDPRNAYAWRRSLIDDLQLALGYAGYDLQGVGPWGPKTTAAVRAFQRDADLVVDGLVGPKTWLALDERTSS